MPLMRWPCALSPHFCVGMQVTFPSDVRILAWNFPQYHRVAENDLHWYPGMTEWDHLRTAVAKERGRRVSK